MSDYISRQAVNDALDRTCNAVCQYSKKQRYTMCDACPLGSAFDAIASLPSVEPKKGKWIENTDHDAKMYGWYHCSECGAVIGTCTNFCSECGANMRETE